MKLSILIPSLKSRANYLTNLMALLKPQVTDDVELIVEVDNGEMTIGEKRNKLLKQAKGKYIAFIDDDDEISRDYISKVLEALERKPDCCSLTGVITTDGNNPQIFEHSLKYSAWKDNFNNDPIKYERPPNHLNTIKREIAIKYDFIPVNHGEDREWSMRVFPDLKTEATINGVIYHYKYRSNK